MKRITKNWLPEEINYLKDNYLSMGAGYCSTFLGRSLHSVKGKIAYLSLNRDNGPVYAKEYLESIVQNSKCITDVLKVLKLSPRSYYNYIKDMIITYSIDTSHFLTISDRNKLGATSVNQYLVKGKLCISSTVFKKKLYASGLKKAECEFCGQGEIWNGKKMSLILDHGDGDHFNNEFSNLRILCPNCNATLDTHCKKKVGELKNKYKNLVYRRKK